MGFDTQFVGGTAHCGSAAPGQVIVGGCRNMCQITEIPNKINFDLVLMSEQCVGV